jgi:hypothetical protein
MGAFFRVLLGFRLLFLLGSRHASLYNLLGVKMAGLS